MRICIYDLCDEEENNYDSCEIVKLPRLDAGIESWVWAVK